MAASVVGEGLIIASIPIRAIGGAKKRNAKNNYIEQYLKGSSSILQPSLNFGLTASGVGFTVNF
ncbi:MAG: hypothetical protein LBB53_00710, partial [Prevotellaceae bacterium]|jgi:hypothetical protein|nr:hypothetical protein [Prevotellaceae bacterium]